MFSLENLKLIDALIRRKIVLNTKNINTWTTNKYIVTGKKLAIHGFILRSLSLFPVVFLCAFCKSFSFLLSDLFLVLVLAAVFLLLVFPLPVSQRRLQWAPGEE